MTSFGTTASNFLVASVALHGLIYLFGRVSRKAFVRQFGHGVSFEELSEEKRSQWESFCQSNYETGFWRLVKNCYVFCHLPGLALTSWLQKGQSSMLVIIGISGTFWIPILYYFFTRSGK